MAALHRNAIANFAGQGWAAVCALLLVPFYVRVLGIEAYGLIGFYAMLQASFQVLDLGLSQTMNREMARYSAFPDKVGEARDFVRTVEVGYWVIGVVVGLSLAGAAPLIAMHWLNSGALSASVVERAVVIMGAVTALQWPLSFYEGGLTGLQKQVPLNLLKIGIATLSGGGAVLILLFVSPTITGFLSWQIIVSAVQVSLVALLLWQALPRSGRSPEFAPRLLLERWRFAAGMSGITLLAIVLMQLDKVILSKLLSLEMFGYYALAGVVAGVVPALIVGPVFTAMLPRFTSLVALEDETGLRHLYHGATQVMAVLVSSAASVLACFSGDILLFWTRNPVTAAAAGPVVTVLVLGMALNALMTLPYALQLSHGWTGLGLRINVGLVVLLVPTIFVMTSRYGAVGGAGAWVILNVIYMVVGVPLTHRRLLRHEMRSWIVDDILPPVITAVMVVGAARLLVGAPAGGAARFWMVSLVSAAALASASIAAPMTRCWVFDKLRRARETTASGD